MENLSKNEMKALLALFKYPEKELNSSNIAKLIGITRMGSLKIMKKLEKEEIITSKKIGKSSVYKLDFEKEYVRSCIKFLLQREAQHSSSYISVWVNQLKEIKSAKAVILFGSVLAKESEARDIDAVIITDNKNLKKVEEEIKKINVISYKRVHPLFQTEEDLKSNINLEDKVILNAIKGIVVLGHEIIINAIKK